MGPFVSESGTHCHRVFDISAGGIWQVEVCVLYSECVKRSRVGHANLRVVKGWIHFKYDTDKMQVVRWSSHYTNTWTLFVHSTPNSHQTLRLHKLEWHFFFMFYLERPRWRMFGFEVITHVYRNLLQVRFPVFRLAGSLTVTTPSMARVHAFCWDVLPDRCDSTYTCSAQYHGIPPSYSNTLNSKPLLLVFDVYTVYNLIIGLSPSSVFWQVILWLL